MPYDCGMGDEAHTPALPSFERPPVVEVAVGVHFLQLPGRNTVALLRMAEIWSTRYPIVREQLGLPPVNLAGARSHSDFRVRCRLSDFGYSARTSHFSFRFSTIACC